MLRGSRLLLGLLAGFVSASCGQPPTVASGVPASEARLFVYVGSNGSGSPDYIGKDGAISAYRANPVTGALTPVAGSPFPIADGPYVLATHPSGRFAFVGAGRFPGPWSVVTYAIEPERGALQPVSAVEVPPLDPGRRGPFVPRAIEILPSGRFAYVLYGFDDFLCEVQGQVRGYEVDALSGALRPLASPSANASNAERGSGLGMSLASGGFLYTVNAGHVHDLDSCYFYSTLRGFSAAETTGALAAIPGSPFAEMARNRRFAWVAAAPAGATVHAGGSEGIATYLRDATGALSLAQVSALPPGLSATFSPAGRLYVADAGAVRGFQTDPRTGALTPISGSPFAGASRPSRIAFDRLGRFAYVADGDRDLVFGYALGADGALRPVPGSPFPTAWGGASSVAIASVE